MGEDPPLNWSIIVTVAQREQHLADCLREAGREVFLPLYTAWRGRFAKRAKIQRCLMPGYVFCDLAPEEVRSFAAHGAIRALHIPSYWQSAVDGSVEELRGTVEAGTYDEPEPKPLNNTKPSKSRNRRARRMAGEQRRKAMEFTAGLQVILHELKKPREIAA